MNELAWGVCATGPEEVDQLDLVDRRLRACVLGAVRWRLALGEAFERLGRLGGVPQLGFSP